MSEHTYWQSKPDVPAHVEQPVEAIRKIAEAHRAYRRDLPSLKGKDIRLALDEWNYWYGPNEYGELGTRYFLQDGLGAAAALHEIVPQQRPLLHGQLRPDRERDRRDQDDAYGGRDGDDRPRAAALSRALRHDARGGRGRPPPLDVAAALTEDGRALTVGVVNPTGEPRRLRLKVAGRTLSGSGQKWVITGKDRWAHNRPGAPRGVDITTEAVEGVQEAAEVGPLSVTLYSLWLR